MRTIKSVLIVLATVLLGAVSGYFFGGGYAVLFMEDAGLEVAAYSLVGAGIGALIVPLSILFLTKRPSREQSSTAQRVQPRSDDPTGAR